MDHLSSCYFCGTTLDDSLRDYRVVPAELRDSDDTTTATLCQSCHGKLERLLAPVVEAAGADGATLDVRATPDGRDGETAAIADAGGSDDGAGSTASGGTGSDPESGAGGDDDGPVVADTESDLVEFDEDPLTETADAESPDSPAGGGETGDADTSEPPSAKGDPEGEPDSGSAADEKAGDQGDEPVRSRRETEDIRPDEAAETGTGTGDGSDGSGRREAEDRTDTGGDTDDGGQSGASRTTVSALEYNKVMRLLQNREFPVDRGEFLTVAANAYGLAEHECAAVIDLAADRGLVGERDGQLVRPK